MRIAAAIMAGLGVLASGCASTDSFSYPSPDGRWVAVVRASPTADDQIRVTVTDTTVDRSYEIYRAFDAASVGIGWRSSEEVRVYFCDASDVELTDAATGDLPMVSVTFETGRGTCFEGTDAQRVPLD